MRTLSLHEARGLPAWRRPTTLLCLMAAAMPLAFATWSALLNNFVIEVAGFTGVEIGWLHTVREIPGFLAIGVIAVILVMREQVLALVSLAMLGVATAITAFFPSLGGILDGHDAVVDRLPLLRDGQPEPATPVAAAGPGAADAGLDHRDRIGSEPRQLRPSGGDVGPLRPELFHGLHDRRRRLPCHHAVVRAGLSAVRGAEPPGQAAGAAAPLLALLRAAIRGRCATADLRRLRGLHDGRALRIRGARAHRPVPAQLPCEHGLCTPDGPRGGPLGRAPGADFRVCRADLRLPRLRRHLLAGLGRRAGRGALHRGPPVLRARLRAEDLLPEDRRSGRHRPHRCGGVHDQPHRRGLPAGDAGLSVGHVAGRGLRTGGGDGRGIALPRAHDPAASGAGPRDALFQSVCRLRPSSPTSRGGARNLAICR